MHRLLALIISLLLLTGLFSGCSSQSQQAKEYTDPTQGIEVSAGSQFIIVLESNPTTGFKWEASFDTSLLKLTKSDYKQSETKPGLVGAGGKEYFTFEGLKKGIDKIIMTYKRSWEQGSANQKVFNVVIK
jgi:inhibitor of cysteine peptidase